MEAVGDNSNFFGQGTFESPKIKFYFTEPCPELGVETVDKPADNGRPTFLFHEGLFSCNHCGQNFTSGPELVKHWQQEQVDQEDKQDQEAYNPTATDDFNSSDDDNGHAKKLKIYSEEEKISYEAEIKEGDGEELQDFSLLKPEIQLERTKMENEKDNGIVIKMEKDIPYEITEYENMESSNSLLDANINARSTENTNKTLVKKDEFEKIEDGYKCKLCGQIYNKIDSMRMHMKRKHNLLCSSCPFIAEDLESLKTHANNEHEGILYPCRFCSKNMLSPEYLRRHEHDYHYEMLTENAEIQYCDQCDYQTYGKYPLKRHIKSVHANEQLECALCDYVAKSLFHYKQHMKGHNGFKRNRNTTMCDKCDYKCCGPAKLAAHMGSKHGAVDAIFYCDKCQFSSPYKSSLYTHMKIKHTLSTFTCEYCDHVSTTKQNLQNHIDNKHLGVKHNCDQCDYQATTLQSLKTHKKGVHLGIKHPCDQCEYKASSYSALHTHRKAKHTDFRVFCQYCDFSASFKRSLNAHIKRLHPLSSIQ